MAGYLIWAIVIASSTMLIIGRRAERFDFILRAGNFNARADAELGSKQHKELTGLLARELDRAVGILSAAAQRLRPA
jgi:hypothetical protein